MMTKRFIILRLTICALSLAITLSLAVMLGKVTLAIVSALTKGIA